MNGALPPTADPRFAATIMHSEAFREALNEFEDTRRLPVPDERSPAWNAWEAACIESWNAVVAVIDHYCAVRVLTVLTETEKEEQETEDDE
jgi:hypothetical protein